MTPGIGSVVVTGAIPVAFRQDSVAPEQGTVVATGLAPTPLQNALTQPAQGSIVITGLDPVVLRATIAQPAQGTLVVTGLQPIALRDSIFQPTQGSIVVTGLAPDVRRDAIVQPTQGTVIVAGLDPTPLQNHIAQPAQGTIVATGLAPTAFRNESVLPDAGAVIVAGLAPTAQRSQLQLLSPISDIASNGWLPSSGPDLYPMLDEDPADFGDYIYSPENPTTEQFEVALDELWPAGTSGHGVQVALESVNQDTAYDFDLVEGTSVLDTWTETVTVAQGQVVRDHPFTAGVIAAISNGANLRVRGVARAP